MPRLENWTLINRIDLYGNKYQRLSGTVYGHDRANSETDELCDGHSIMTSKLISIDMDDSIAITCSGTVYELGEKSNVESL